MERKVMEEYGDVCVTADNLKQDLGEQEAPGGNLSIPETPGKKPGKNGGLSAKKYLGQLEVIDTKIQQRLEELEELKADVYHVGGVDYSREKVQALGKSDRLSKEVVRFMTLNDEINTEIDEFTEIKRQVIKQIQSLNESNYIKVLFKVYVQYKSLKITSYEMKMSYQYVRIIHKKALASFEVMYPDLHYLT